MTESLVAMCVLPHPGSAARSPFHIGSQSLFARSRSYETAKAVIRAKAGIHLGHEQHGFPPLTGGDQRDQRDQRKSLWEKPLRGKSLWEKSCETRNDDGELSRTAVQLREDDEAVDSVVGLKSNPQCSSGRSPAASRQLLLACQPLCASLPLCAAYTCRTVSIVSASSGRLSER